jgi:para-aminobenzoate synthetase component 1
MPYFSVNDIPYLTDSCRYFEAIGDLPSPIWLDSGRPKSHFGRYDLISAQPSSLLQTRGAMTTIRENGSEAESTLDPFDLIAERLNSNCEQAPRDLPFCGGAMGYFSYDLGRRIETLPEIARRDIKLPDMHLGIYDWAIVQDHQQQHAWLICQPTCAPQLQQDLLKRCQSAAKENSNSLRKAFNINDFKGLIDVDTYKDAIAKIHHYIKQGDCYQVNFTQRFSADFEGDTYSAYKHLRTLLPSPFSAYMGLDEDAIMSFSPERFIQVSGRHVETKPIKGTMPRDDNPYLDQRNAESLQDSGKDRAENLMIVDLLRNDLSKNCELGSVRVPSLFALESYPNVHHLVSTVTGTLKRGSTPLNLLRDSFPGGSITGAPKLRAMEIIEELEPTRRSLYCGSIGYISANGNMDTNIAIRTLVKSDSKVHCWGGGGIVADSKAESEYEESLAKIRVLMEGLRQ